MFTVNWESQRKLKKIIPEESGNPKICHCPHSKFGHRTGSYSPDVTWINRLATSCERSKAKEYNLYLVIQHKCCIYILRKGGLEDEHGFKIGGRSINNWVTQFSTDDAHDIQTLLMIVKEHSEKMGRFNMKISN